MDEELSTTSGGLGSRMYSYDGARDVPFVSASSFSEPVFEDILSRSIYDAPLSVYRNIVEQMPKLEPIKEERKMSRRQEVKSFERSLTELLLHVLNDVPEMGDWSKDGLAYGNQFLTPERTRFRYQRENLPVDHITIHYHDYLLCRIYIKPKRIHIPPRPSNDNGKYGFGSWDYASKVLEKIMFSQFGEVRIIHD